MEQRFSVLLAQLPATFTEAQCEEGLIRSSLWAYLTPLNRRRSAELLFSFLAWDVAASVFIVEPSDFDWSSKLGVALSMRHVLSELTRAPVVPRTPRPRAPRRPRPPPSEAQPLEPRVQALIEWLERLRVTTDE